MLLKLIESIYAGVVSRRRERCLKESWHPAGAVKLISVGNLTMGGTGKTPAVQWLAKKLAGEGSVVVVGRGYGGSLCETGAVVSDGKSTFHTAAEVGDEALLHARFLPDIPVVIGKDRIAAVQTAVEKFDPQFIVLDDAFQYWSLKRDFNLVLLDAARPFDNGHTLPLGKLRELPEALCRADAVLLTRCGNLTPALLQRTRNQVSAYCTAPVFLSDHEVLDVRLESDGTLLPLDHLKGQKVLSVSAIADPLSWKKTLKNLDVAVKAQLVRRDHHQWKAVEVQHAASRAQQKGATAMVTTEKDAVKLSSKWCAPLPLYSIRIALKLENEDGLWKELQKR